MHRSSAPSSPDRRAVRARFFLAVAPVMLAASAAGQDDRIGSLTLADVSATFAELERACAADGGHLWGVPVCGPVLLVDPVTRKVAANRADALGRLSEKGGVFVGVLPADQPLANAPLEWAGVRWAMVLTLFLGENEKERVTVLAHESFHRVQPELGLYSFAEENEHLDELEGRVGLQLEWNALQKALLAEGEARIQAVEDALDLRAARRARFPGSAARENAVEIREGLANYTGLRLARRTPAEVVAYVEARRLSEDGLVRSFAYNSGPLLGYLLDDADPEWRTSVRSAGDLGVLLASALDLEPSSQRAAAAEARHGGAELRVAEERRARERKVRLDAWTRTLVDGPVLVVDLSLVSTATMDTRKVHAFDAGRTVYTERKLVAAWGTLQVHDGAILEDKTARQGRVSLTGAIVDNSSSQVIADGWSLELAAGWTLASGERAGDLVLRKSP